MTADPLAEFSSVWCADFEFYQPDGELPRPLCMVARELRSGQLLRLWEDDLLEKKAPIPGGPNSLFVAYYAAAEVSCYLVLGWQPPARILDLYAEFCCKTSGLKLPYRRNVLGCLTYHGLDGITAVEKADMQALAMRGGEYTAAERVALLDYCQTDVDALVRLLPIMLPEISLLHALLRGHAMVSHADESPRCTDRRTSATSTARKFRCDQGPAHSGSEQGLRLLCCQGRSVVVQPKAICGISCRQNIPWPRLETGGLELKQKTFRQMAKCYLRIAPLADLRHTLSELRLEKLTVGADGRNRCMLGAFGSKTGRNQPSNSKFIFGPSVWLRGLIRPERGKALAYVDWSQQEFGIAAALSGDTVMMKAYTSGDPYLEFAKQVGAVPSDATKHTYGDIREQFKQCVLAVQYGMMERSLADKLGVCTARAEQLLRSHREAYPQFWRWSEAAVCQALLHGRLHTVFGWFVHAGLEPKITSLANFPMQANGAEMLRLACCLATERGLQICAPVHDALLIEAEADRIEEAVSEVQGAMREASRVVLNGFELRSDAKIVRWPDRYMDPRGRKFWDLVQRQLAERTKLCPNLADENGHSSVRPERTQLCPTRPLSLRTL